MKPETFFMIIFSLWFAAFIWLLSIVYLKHRELKRKQRALDTETTKYLNLKK